MWSEVQASFLKLQEVFQPMTIAMLAMVISKFVYLIANPKRGGTAGYYTSLFMTDNTALAIAIGGYVGALGIALNCGVSIAVNAQWSVGTICIGAVLSILLLTASMFINDKILMYGIDNTDEISKNNVSVAIVETSGLLATGFILRGVLMSNSASFLDKFIDIGCYWIIGQILLMLGGILYKKLDSNDMTASLKTASMPIAILFGGFIISYGMIIETALTGATSNIFGELPTIIIISVAGLFFLSVIKFVGSIFFIDVADKNMSASILLASILISLGQIFSGIIDESITKSKSTVDIITEPDFDIINIEPDFKTTFPPEPKIDPSTTKLGE